MTDTMRRGARLAIGVQLVLRPRVTGLSPGGQVVVVVGGGMLADVVCGFVAWRIARHRLLTRLLIPADVVNIHRGGELQFVVVDASPGCAEAEIENHGHWFLRNRAAVHVAIWPDCVASDHEGHVITNEPGLLLRS